MTVHMASNACSATNQALSDFMDAQGKYKLVLKGACLLIEPCFA